MSSPRRSKARTVVGAAGVVVASLSMIAGPSQASARGPAPGGGVQTAATAQVATEIGAVSCPSTTSCFAAGNSVVAPVAGTGGPGVDVTLVEHWNGKAWSIQPTPNPPNPTDGTGSGFAAISCSSTKACTAVGASDNGVVLAERWNGSDWTIQSTPTTGGKGLAGVSCSTATSCVAVGVQGGANSTVLVERWNGSTWSTTPTPTIRGAHTSGLYAVSCTTPKACTAVGTALTTTLIPVVERWNGSKWRLQKTPATYGPTSAQLFGVSCTAATACTAVGFLGTEKSLAQQWNGHSWKIRRSPGSTPVDATPYPLSSVSCTSAKRCTTVGETEKHGTDATLAERWNGSTWSKQKTPNRAAPGGLAGGDSLVTVSCKTAKFCTAIGASGFYLVVAETWNGKTWTVHPFPDATSS